jgi:tryptophan-rich sensory protein
MWNPAPEPYTAGMSRGKSILGLVVAVSVCLLVGGASSLATATSVKSWYPLLQKPVWTPPAAVFGPVWTLLYAMMGVSVWWIWRDGTGSARRIAIRVFAVQLALNALWSVLFFGLRRPDWAFVEILLLWAAIVATFVVFRRIRPAAAALLVPYLVWVSFAARLNLALWMMNR